MIKVYYNLVSKNGNKNKGGIKMTDYKLQSKASFNVAGTGVELKSHYTDFMGINQEKTDFYKKIQTNGTFDKLKSVAKTPELFLVNEAYDDKMMYYFGVQTDETLPEVTRNIEFPASEYLIISGTSSDIESLAMQLTGSAFGDVLMNLSDYAYVGGPNTVVVNEQKENQVTGEIWIPVVKQ